MFSSNWIYFYLYPEFGTVKTREVYLNRIKSTYKVSQISYRDISKPILRPIFNSKRVQNLVEIRRNLSTYVWNTLSQIPLASNRVSDNFLLFTKLFPPWLIDNLTKKIHRVHLIQNLKHPYKNLLSLIFYTKVLCSIVNDDSHSRTLT